MKMSLIYILIFLISQPIFQDTEKKLIEKTWGEVNEHATSYRGKAGLILLNFKADHTFESFESTCTGDNVLQTGKWKVEKDTLIFNKIKTSFFQHNSIRKGKILSEKNSGKIKYRIKELTKNLLVLECKKESVILYFETVK